MKKLSISFLLSLIMFSFVGNVHASLIQYDVVGGVDNYGNPISGHIDFESIDGIVNFDPSSGEDGNIIYNIVEFNLQTEAGANSGSGGFLSFGIWVDRLNHPDPWVFYPGAFLIFYSDVSPWNIYPWMNDSNTVEFVGAEATIEDYSHLSQTICINTDLFVRIDDPIWEPLGDLTIQRHSDPTPVPEPGTMLLLGTGLLGLVGYRKRFKK